jgi:diketogulonate reductase-like aldo/keto reductase
MPRYEDTLLVWSVFEEYFNQSLVHSLGLSNIYDLDTLKVLYETVIIKPSFVQNRFYAKTGYDKEIRRFCQEKGIIYQSFWSLTANKQILKRFALLLSSSSSSSPHLDQWETRFDCRETELHSSSSFLPIPHR